MATIYTTGYEEIAAGLQGCNTCDAALKAAQSAADRLGLDVILADDDGEWLVHPMAGGERKPADQIGAEEGDDE